MKILVTGGCGFLGSNLASHGITNGHDVAIIDNLSRKGSKDNLKWLKSLGKLTFYNSDLREVEKINQIIKKEQPETIFHLGGQVAMTTSLSDPRKDFEINVQGGFNVLEAVRLFSPNTSILFSSTNKVYGDLDDIKMSENDSRYYPKFISGGFDENLPLKFASPYGCSKGTIDQYMSDYYRMYGIKTVVFRHSSIYGGRQFSSVDQGWIGWFINEVLDRVSAKKAREIDIAGNGKQVRDILHSQDLIACYYGALKSIETTKGKVFNIGGGVGNEFSVLELIDHVSNICNIQVSINKKAPRASDQKYFVSNNNKAFKHFHWKPKISKRAGLLKMVEWCSSLK